MSWINHPGALFSDYTGSSMTPLFCRGDYLKVIPYNGKSVRVGDVVVFNSITEDQQVVHRVISLRNGIWTRGDNNARVDLCPVSARDIIGKVISVQKKDRVVPVQGGMRGYLRALPRWFWKDCERYLSKILHPPYRRLAEAGVLRALLAPWVRPRIHCFGGADGKTRMHVCIGRRVIAVYRPAQRCWHIRRPFRLIVDEQCLPDRIPEDA